MPTSIILVFHLLNPTLNYTFFIICATIKTNVKRERNKEHSLSNIETWIESWIHHFACCLITDKLVKMVTLFGGGGRFDYLHSEDNPTCTLKWRRRLYSTIWNKCENAQSMLAFHILEFRRLLVKNLLGTMMKLNHLYHDCGPEKEEFVQTEKSL